MKLLLDANLSWRLLDPISLDFPGSIHVNNTPLSKPAKDAEIWRYAFQYDYVIVTNDEDFIELSVFRGFPPKVILLRTGNISTKQLSKILIDHKDAMLKFNATSDYGILEIY